MDKEYDSQIMKYDYIAILRRVQTKMKCKNEMFKLNVNILRTECVKRRITDTNWTMMRVVTAAMY